MHPFLIVFALIVFSLGSSLHATVGIYFGPENQSTRQGHYRATKAKDVRLSGKVYLLIDLEAWRSVEIRLHGKQYRMRPERQFFHQTFVYTANTDATVWSDAGRGTVTAGPIYYVSWQGKKTRGRGVPNFDPKTGMYSWVPTSLTGRQDLHFLQEYDTDARFVSTRRTASVTVHAPLTKESNAAEDTFEQALQRLKSRLEAAGYTASQTDDGDFLD
jgi:hypothetical protein